MMRSMYAAVAGLRNHQIRMDVIGNNIANVNTVGFKSSRVTFQDTFYQMIRSGSAPDTGTGGTGGGLGGTTPRQVGIGMAINSIDTYFTQGAVLPTGNFTDLMIQGDGFFVLQDAEDNKYYTRAGVFGFDAAGNLVNKSNGMIVVGLVDGNPMPLTWKNLKKPTKEDGNEVGSISEIGTLSISATGQIIGDGVVMGTIGLVKFANPEGLEKVGQNLFKWTEAAHPDGAPDPAQAGSGGLAFTTIVPGALEMSNVDLALEFTEMITTQRGFQANARTITTSDEMLQDLVNLKR